ncbi:glycosyl transferase family [Arthrobacter sp. Hiyo8]|nr:glycosyl transferase family [Arthrobacter sp. Hiyo8]
MIVWGSWVLVTGLVFSFMAGIIHPYYAVALARASPGSRAWAGAFVAAPRTARRRGRARCGSGRSWIHGLRSPGRHHRLWSVAALAVLLGALAAAAGLLLSGRFPVRILHRTTAALALAASLAGPLAYSISTASVTHSGAIPSAGPATTFGGFGGFGARGGFGQNNAAQNTPRSPSNSRAPRLAASEGTGKAAAWAACSAPPRRRRKWLPH